MATRNIRRAMYIYAIVVISILTISVVRLKQEVERFKTESTIYYDEAAKSQQLYEGERNAVIRLQKDLADARERLLQASKREQAAKLRASRSRRSESVAVPSVERSGSFWGLRDITMYCPTGNRTASGKIPQRGMVATLSRSIPFGTRISIEGLGIFTVEDRIGHGSDFDLFTPSCSEAIQFGRKHRRVTILN